MLVVGPVNHLGVGQGLMIVGVELAGTDMSMTYDLRWLRVICRL